MILRKSKQLYVGTVNTNDLLKKYLRWNIDGVITNRPDRSIELRDDGGITNTFIKRVKILLK